MVQIPDDRFDLFGKILVTILARLGHAGQIVGHRDDGDSIIFQFRPVENLDVIYPEIQDDGYDIIRDTVNSQKLDIRKYRDNLEMRFPRTVVFLVRAILSFNPKLEFHGN